MPAVSLNANFVLIKDLAFNFILLNDEDTESLFDRINEFLIPLDLVFILIIEYVIGLSFIVYTSVCFLINCC
jgi:hypothetical protein